MAVFEPVELLGFVAGIIICISAVPQIRILVLDPGAARHESIARNLLIVAGNLLWLVYGFFVSSVSIAVMCGVGVLLNALVLHFAIRSRYGRRRGADIHSVTNDKVTNDGGR